MAHLSRLVGEASDDRGQLLVVGAFAIALLIVALAVTLNAAAYTETLSTDGDGGVAQDAIRFERDVDQSVGGTMLAVSREGDADVTDLNAALTEWEKQVNEDGATRGVVADVEVVGPTTYGARIAQENESRGFVDANGTANWTVVDATSNVAQFRLTLNRTTLTNESEPNPFTVSVTDGTDDWNVTFVDNGSAINATVVDPSGTTICSVPMNATAGNGTATTSNTTVVNFAAGTLGNQSCPALAFTDTLASPYTISFENAANTTGTFELVVDKQVGSFTPGDRFGGDGPTLTRALWSTDVTISYETARVSYATQITVYVEGADA
jgi:hypothetical protein